MCRRDWLPTEGLQQKACNWYRSQFTPDRIGGQDRRSRTSEEPSGEGALRPRRGHPSSSHDDSSAATACSSYTRNSRLQRRPKVDPPGGRAALPPSWFSRTLLPANARELVDRFDAFDVRVVDDKRTHELEIEVAIVPVLLMTGR